MTSHWITDSLIFWLTLSLWTSHWITDSLYLLAHFIFMNESLNNWLTLSSGSLYLYVQVTESLTHFIFMNESLNNWLTLSLWTSHWIIDSLDFGNLCLQNWLQFWQYSVVYWTVVPNQNHICKGGEIGENQRTCWCDIAKLYHMRVFFLRSYLEF